MRAIGLRKNLRIGGKGKTPQIRTTVNGTYVTASQGAGDAAKTQNSGRYHLGNSFRKAQRRSSSRGPARGRRRPVSGRASNMRGITRRRPSSRGPARGRRAVDRMRRTRSRSRY